MQAIITNDLRITSADYFQNDVSNFPMYIYYGGSTAWPDPSNPPDVVDSTLGRIASNNDVLGLKRIFNTDVVSVLPRIDWTSGTIYDEYTDDANIFDDKNPITNEYYKFYVVTDEFNVYKCLSNNDRAQSTTKPTGTTVTSFETPDGYKWKYMYTISSNDAFNYMSPNWIPCYTIYTNDGSNQWNVEAAAIDGSIEHIVVTNGGASYNSNDLPTLTISGDGTGATGTVEIDDLTGTVSKINITNVGSGYTYATGVITGTTGIGATVRIVISPEGGHGYDARRELGATYKMIRIAVNGNESGILPTGVTYRKAGILIEPLSLDAGAALTIGNTLLYQVGETVTGATQGATGTIRSINKTKNRLYLEQVTGTFSINENISSQTYNSTQLLDYEVETNIPLSATVVNGTGYLQNSGTPIYFQNREAVTRGTNQTEEFRFIIQF